MNTNTTPDKSSGALLDGFRGKLPSRIVPFLITAGLLSHTPDNAVPQTVSNPPALTQTNIISEVNHVEQRVSEVLAQPPENALRTEAIQIFTHARKQRSFQSVGQQERFFHILAALEQSVPLEKAVFVVEQSRDDYLKLAPKKVLQEMGINTEELRWYIV